MASPPRQIVIDDTDLSQLRYSNSGHGWFRNQGIEDSVGNFGPTYNKTEHGTKQNNSISFSFVGSSVTVWGTTAIKQIQNSTSFDPSWECFIDERNIGATKPFTFAENNWILCQQDTISDGSHELTINITSAGNTFWFDYLTYTPSQEVSYEKAVILVQNTDSALEYDAGWGALGGTANMTTQVGSQVKFDFVGTSLTWVGFIPTELPHGPSVASYSVDNGSSVTFNLNGLSSTTTTTVYNQAFFTIPDLNIGPHTILVTYGGGDGPSTPLTLDYLLVTNISKSLPVTTDPVTISTSPTSATTPSESPIAQSSTPIGLVVGGVLGGLAVIIILLFAFWCWRRQRVPHIESGSTPNEPRLLPEPFTSAYPTTYAPSQSNISSAASNPVPPIVRKAQSSSHTSTHTPATSVDTSDLSGYAAGTIDQIQAIHKSRSMEPRSTVASVTHDSGIRLRSQPNVIVEDIPPTYTET